MSDIDQLIEKCQHAASKAGVPKIRAQFLIAEAIARKAKATDRLARATEVLSSQ